MIVSMGSIPLAKPGRVASNYVKTSYPFLYRCIKYNFETIRDKLNFQLGFRYTYLCYLKCSQVGILSILAQTLIQTQKSSQGCHESLSVFFSQVLSEQNGEAINRAISNLLIISRYRWTIMYNKRLCLLEGRYIFYECLNT